MKINLIILINLIDLRKSQEPNPNFGNYGIRIYLEQLE